MQHALPPTFSRRAVAASDSHHRLPRQVNVWSLKHLLLPSDIPFLPSPLPLPSPSSPSASLSSPPLAASSDDPTHRLILTIRDMPHSSPHSCALAIQLMGDAADAPEKSFPLSELLSSPLRLGLDSLCVEFSRSGGVGLVTQVNLRLVLDPLAAGAIGDDFSLRISKIAIIDVKQPNQSLGVCCNGSKGDGSFVTLSRTQPSANIKSERLLAKVTHAGFALCVRFSSCGQMFAVSCDDASLYVWSHQGFCLPNGLQIWQSKRLVGHELNVTHVEWSPDDQMIASASFDNTVRVWCVATCAVIARLDGHASYVRGVAWDPVGSYLYSQGDDGLRCWKIDTWRQQSERTFEPPYGRCSEEVLYADPQLNHLCNRDSLTFLRHVPSPGRQS
jgi:WD40 repeat protein